jgi:hypothetical protein
MLNVKFQMLNLNLSFEFCVLRFEFLYVGY